MSERDQRSSDDLDCAERRVTLLRALLSAHRLVVFRTHVWKERELDYLDQLVDAVEHLVELKDRGDLETFTPSPSCSVALPA
jgi:hypothetical protein